MRTLQNLIDRYLIDRSKNSLTETFNLRISNQKFSNETIICDKFLSWSAFKQVNFTNINFTNVNFELSCFHECVFKDCTFDSTSFYQAKFENCSLVNCQIKNCELADIDFSEITFDRCQFARTEKGGGLVKGWFESCHFLETTFDGFQGIPILQTVVVDSKFTKSKKSIEFQGDFFLMDILYSGSGIDQMFRD